MEQNKYKAARNRAHTEFFYSMRDSHALEEFEQAMRWIDFQEHQEQKQAARKAAAIESRRRELHL